MRDAMIAAAAVRRSRAMVIANRTLAVAVPALATSARTATAAAMVETAARRVANVVLTGTVLPVPSTMAAPSARTATANPPAHPVAMHRSLPVPLALKAAALTARVQMRLALKHARLKDGARIPHATTKRAVPATAPPAGIASPTVAMDLCAK